MEAWLSQAGGIGDYGGGGGTEDTPPESPTPENPEGDGDGEGDPPEDEPEDDGEGDPPEDEAPACDCDTSGFRLLRCNCGAQTRQEDGTWKKKCNGKANKQFPCPRGKCRNSHSGSTSDCTCSLKFANDPNADEEKKKIRSLWKICNQSNSSKCNGTCSGGQSKANDQG